MSACCPTCGQAVPDTNLRFDPDSGVVIKGEASARLTKHEAIIFSTLHNAKGRVVSVGAIMDAIYGLEGEEPQWEGFRVRISHMRRKLAPLGIDLKTHWGRGYSL